MREVVPHERLRATWADDGWVAATELTASLEPVPRSRTRVRVRHEGFELLPGGEALVAEHRDGWRAHLEALRRHVEQLETS